MSDERPRYFEAAVIAVDDAYRDQQFDPGLMLQRAQALATLAGVEQARIANLIAWKQLRQAASGSPSSLPNAGDAISDEIETTLGIIGSEAEAAASARLAAARVMLGDLVEAWEREASRTDGGVVDGLLGCADDARAVLDGPLA